jgi:hypothetical protein
MANHVNDWLAEALAVVPLVDDLPGRLMSLSVLPQTRDAAALLEALLRVRQALRLPSPNTSISPISDKLAQTREDIRPALGALCESLERGICSCIVAGARDDRVVPASDFRGGLHRLDLDHLVGRQVLLGGLSELPVDHPVRKRLPEGGYVLHGGVQAVVLGPVRASYPTDPVPVWPGQWYYLNEIVSVTRQWRQAQLAREAEHQDAELRRRLEREERSRDPMARRAAELDALSAPARMGSA